MQPPTAIALKSAWGFADTESICTEQRGFFNAVQQWQTLFVSFGISALGVLLGEHIISNDIAYWIAIALALFPTIPLGLVGLGESPGCWAPEPFAPLSSAAEEERRQQRDDRCCKRASATASDFVSAFRYPPFRWLFVCNVFNQCCETRMFLGSACMRVATST